MDSATPWYVPLARAVPALVLAVVITFTAEHSAGLGFVTFGIYAVVTGAVLVAAGLRQASRGIVRAISLAQGLVGVLAGVIALALPSGGLPFFVFLLTAFAVITGFLEFYLGVRARAVERRAASAVSERTTSSRDWIFVGGLTVVLAVVMLLVPPSYALSFVGPDGVDRELTASIIIVGALGAYWAITGVYLVIAGLSLRWSNSASANSSSTGSNGAATPAGSEG